MKKYLLISVLLVLSLSAVAPVQAQEDGVQGAIYIIQPGDTLWTIARKLHVSYRELLAENNLTEDSAIHPGETLSIPDLEDVSGVLVTKRVPYGESLSSLSDRYQISEGTLIRLNRLTSPMELYSGVSLVLVGDEEGEPPVLEGKRIALENGQSTLEAAVAGGVNPWRMVADSGIQGTWDLVPGEVVRISGGEDAGPGGFPGAVRKVGYSPDAFVQGNTMVFRVSAPEGTTLEGAFGDRAMHFFRSGEEYVALQGISAIASSGLRTISLHGELEDGTPFAHRQAVQIESGNYNFVRINGVPENTVSVKLSQKEHEKLARHAREATPKKRWKGKMSLPIPSQYGTPYPLYGDRRSFNGSAYNFYHSGIDFSTYAFDIDIYAAAPGKVVYTGKNSPIYGGVTMIDHGWGVYTAYGHQAEILVQEGQRVQEGDVIGKVGNTGRSTGPHLHWEVWVGGIPVDPMDWLEQAYP